MPIGRDRKAMELRHLRYFVASPKSCILPVQRNGSHQQPPLSLQIRHLEQEIEFVIPPSEARCRAYRDRGYCCSTSARAPRQVEQAKTAVLSHARARRAHPPRLAGATYIHQQVIGIIRAYRVRYPDVAISPEQSNTARLIASLRSREIDVAFVRPPIIDTEGLSIEPGRRTDGDRATESHPHAGDRSMPLAALGRTL